MNFLVYSVEPLNENATLDSYAQEADDQIIRIIQILNRMSIDRVRENETINLLVENVEYVDDSGIATAEIYKLTNPGKPLHQLAKDDDDEVTIEEILSEHDDALIPGVLGIKKVDEEIFLLVENNFGSYFVTACKGLDVTPRYSSETIRSIQESETIGRTTLDFAEDYDLSASLFKPPEDGDLREDKGFGNVDVLNKFSSLLNISRAHRMSLDIGRDEWLANVEIFDELIETGIVSTIRIEGTKNGIVKLGEGGERAIRKKLKTRNTGTPAIEEAFQNLPE